MNKWFYRLIAMVVCICVMVGSAGSAQAAENQQEDGTQDTREGVVLPDIDDSDEGLRKYKLFDMTINAVYNTLNTSGSEKYLTKSSVLAENSSASKIYVIGLLYHSTSSSSNPHNYFRTGLCYYNTRTQSYYPEFYTQPTSGRTLNEPLCSVELLSSQTTYYGFVTNLAGSGYVTGKVGFYYSVE